MKSRCSGWRVELAIDRPLLFTDHECYHRIGDTVSRTIYSIPLLIPVFSGLFWTHLRDKLQQGKSYPGIGVQRSSFEAIWDPRHDDFERSRGAFTVCRQARRPQSMQLPAIKPGLDHRHGTKRTAGLDVLRSEKPQQIRGVDIFFRGGADPGTCYVQLSVFGAEL